MLFENSQHATLENVRELFLISDDREKWVWRDAKYFSTIYQKKDDRE